MSAQPKPSPIFMPPLNAPPLFFLHIPKTAGSSNNAFLRSLYGAGNFQDHTENLLPDLTSGRARALRVDAVSGHIPLWAWNLYEGAENYLRVTILRDPWARVVSHINWVYQYKLGKPLPKQGPGAKSLAHMTELVALTDFEDRGSLLRLFQAANAMPYFSSFDNYQTRMLRQGAMDAMEKRLAAADLDAACDALSGFFHIGFCEAQQDFQSGLLAKLAMPGRVQDIRANSTGQKRLKVENDLAREVFAPWYEKDQALVGFARGMAQAEK